MTRELAKIAFACSLMVGVGIAASPAGASAPLLDHFGGPLGYGTSCLYHNDDGSSESIPFDDAFPHGLRFFAETHFSAFVNTNGNITFSGPLSTFTPNAFPVANQPMIAPYWADVDTRHQDGQCDGPVGFSDVAGLPCQNPPENGIWWHIEPGLMVVTWDRVGYYNCKMDKRMSFQLILTEAYNPCGGEGDFDVEFRFNLCEWTTGDASGGSGGLGGTPAQAGFDAGDMENYVEVQGSRTNDIHHIMCNQSNVGEPGVWKFEVRGGVIGGCPGAGEPCDTGQPGLCGMGVQQCAGADTICVPLFEPGEERCSGLDESCSGQADDEEELCGSFEVCHRGMCVPPCMEFGCLDGQVCGPEDVCVDPECYDVICDDDLRCIEGECVDPCHGVVCPDGLECRVGRCLDLCDSIECDDCTICIDGACEIMCQYEDCPPGETCLEDGRCVEDACANASCPDGHYCSGGTCIDPCEGAVCPHGEVCWRGRCLPPSEVPDNGGDGGQNGTGSGDGGTGDDPDGGNVEATAGCDCAIHGARGPATVLLWLLVLAGGLLTLRRRR